jgi:glucokinase
LATLAIGIDIGGTKAALGLVDLTTARVVLRREIPTPDLAESGAGFVAALAVELAALRAAAGTTGPAASTAPVAGIGLCEIVSPEGAVLSGHRVDWRGLSLKPLGPVALASDVQAAARAEAAFGAGRGFPAFVYLNLGTGVSHALVLGGLPWTGAHGAALVSANGRVPNVTGGRIKGHYIPEDLAGGAAISARYAAGTGRTIPAREVLARAAAGEPVAMAIADTAADIAGALVAQAVNWLDPDAVILGGGLGTAGGSFGDRLVTAARAGIWLPAARDLPILTAELGADAGLVGAALLSQGAGDRASTPRQIPSTGLPAPDSLATVKQ